MTKKLPAHITKIASGKFRVRYQKSTKFPIDYDESFDTLEEAIKEAKKSKKEIPNCPYEVDKINETVKNDLSLIEYKTITENIQTKEKELKDSVKQFK